ncbi:MAG TPA: HAMP domain-containing sensor histidine kinase, partial [Candidatus Nitrosocosmicus sp.]|nr:HAMP domain-containing sensor histidine kinase [Candidatus Nitrosocosmicus sp.]
NLVLSMLEWLRSNKDGFSYNPLIWELSKVTQEAICIIQTKAAAKGIRLINGIEEGIVIFADRVMIGLVLRNLLYNAVKFTGSGGFISIKAQQAEQKVIVAVQDSGTGIDPNKAKRLFNENHIYSTMGTAGEKGTGLGLLICKDFVRFNGGEIWVESVPGKGSTFYFSLPSEEIRNNMKIAFTNVVPKTN